MKLRRKGDNTDKPFQDRGGIETTCKLSQFASPTINHAQEQAIESSMAIHIPEYAKQTRPLAIVQITRC
jgi:hypothetical protein